MKGQEMCTYLKLKDCKEVEIELISHIPLVGDPKPTAKVTNTMAITYEYSNEDYGYDLVIFETDLSPKHPTQPAILYTVCTKTRSKHYIEYDEIFRTTDKDKALECGMMYETGYILTTHERFIERCPVCGKEEVTYTKNDSSSIRFANTIKERIMRYHISDDLNIYDSEVKITKKRILSEKRVLVPQEEIWDVDVVQIMGWHCGCKGAGGFNEIPF